MLGYGFPRSCSCIELERKWYGRNNWLRGGSSSWKAAEEAGLTVKETAEAVKGADVVMALIPDELQANVYAQDIAPNLKQGAYLHSAHGFNIHFGKIVPREDINVFMVL